MEIRLPPASRFFHSMMLVIAACASTADVLAKPDDRTVVQLVDGSRFVGRLETPTLKVRTAFGSLSIPMERVHIASAKESGFVVKLQNGDRITGALERRSFRLSGNLGALQLPVAKVTGVWPASLGVDLGDPGWGKADDGLQARLTCKTRKVKIGEQIELLLEVRNTAKTTRSIVYPDIRSFLSVNTRNRRNYPVFLRIKRTGPGRQALEEMERLMMQHATLALAPGKAMRVRIHVEVTNELRQLQQAVNMKKLQDLDREMSLDTTWYCRAGTFTIQAIYQKPRHSSARNFTLYTKPIKLEITE